MTEYPILQTKRLTLRRFHLTDVDDVLAYANDEEWQRYLLPLPYPYERVHAEQFVAESFLSDWKSKAVFAIVLDDAVIGSISLSIGKESQVGSIGYAIARKHWGNGYGTEAARAVVDWAFEEFCLAKVSTEANVENRRSWRLMERIGMTRRASPEPDPRRSQIRTEDRTWRATEYFARSGNNGLRKTKSPNRVARTDPGIIVDSVR